MLLVDLLILGDGEPVLENLVQVTLHALPSSDNLLGGRHLVGRN